MQFSPEQTNDLVEYLDNEGSSDATPSICGFIFQNLLAIYELFQNSDDGFVFCECVEDVSYCGTDGSLTIIQAKNYSNTIKEETLCSIVLNFFYAHSILHESFSSIRFFIYTGIANSITFPDYAKVKAWIDKEDKDINEKGKEREIKAKQKGKKAKPLNNKYTRARGAFLSSNSAEFNDFSSNCGSKSVGDLESLRDEVGKLLLDYCQKTEKEIYASVDNKNDLKEILFSLAYQTVLSSLEIIKNDSKRKIQKRQISKNNVVEKWKSVLVSNNSAIPLTTVLAFVHDFHLDLKLKNPDMDADMSTALDKLHENTMQWLQEQALSDDKKIAFISTVCQISLEECRKWNTYSIGQKVNYLHDARYGMQDFFLYLWKIIIDIYWNTKAESDLELDKYLDSTNGYIRFSYNSKDGVILPSVSRGLIQDKTDIYIEHLAQKPPLVWYMDCDSNYRNKHEYSWGVNKINEENIHWKTNEIDDSNVFYIECMNCINIGKGKWKIIENCDECIFSNNCKGYGEVKW